MKKSFLFIVLLCALCSLSSCDTGSTFTQKGISYQIIDENSVEVKGYDPLLFGFMDKFKKSLDIPSTVSYKGSEYTVTSIGENAFVACLALKSVDLPDGLISIGDYAFLSCPSLTSVTLPDGVESIGDYAFLNCVSLSSVNIPESVKSIGKGAFRLCSSLTSVDLPKGVISIGEGAFDGFDGMTSATVPFDTVVE